MTLYTCEPLHISERGDVNAERIVVGWSPADGLYGPDADVVRAVLKRGRVFYGGAPRYFVPAPAEVRSLEDLALVLGDSWALPAALMAHYPREEEEPADMPAGVCR